MDRRYKHGQTLTKDGILMTTPTYQSWNKMLMGYRHPEKRGYTHKIPSIDERWFEFSNFLADMGERPKGTVLGRKDFKVGYDKGNCHWTTQRSLLRSRSTVKLTLEDAKDIRYMYSTGYYTYRELASIYGVCYSLIGGIIRGKFWKD